MNGTSASAATPGRHEASVSTSSRPDDAAAGVAQDVLEEDLQRHGRGPEVDPVGQDVESVVVG